MACPRFGSAPYVSDAWLAVDQIEQALDGVQFGAERQLGAMEEETVQLERLYEDLQRYTRGCTLGVCAAGERPGSWGPAHADTRRRDLPPRSEPLQPTADMRSLLVCYFPREANKAMIRDAFAPFGLIDSVYLVHKQGKPACYGFVNFADHAAAGRALAAAESEQIELVDKRGVVWHVKAEWTTTPEIPKKPKKKKRKDEDAGHLTPPLDFGTMARYPDPSFRPHQFAQMSYRVPDLRDRRAGASW